MEALVDEIALEAQAHVLPASVNMITLRARTGSHLYWTIQWILSNSF